MGSRILRLVCITLLASAFPGSAGHDTVKQQMRFAAEAAQQGLWREAAFRWEKILKEEPDNARVHNNLGVAYESMGQFERARKEYEEAKRLAPDNKEIRGNFAAFLELCKQVKECGPGPEATPGQGAIPASPSPSPGGEEAPTPAPPDGPPPGA
jgi:Tfp pilus assembly protein PilF